MTVKGYPDQTKLDEGNPQFATVNPVRLQQNGLDVVAHAYVFAVGTDAAEAGSTNHVIVATAHAAYRGDVIRWTSGDLDGFEFKVASTTADTITLVEEMPESPDAADTFAIMRHRFAAVSSDGSIPLAIEFASTLYPVTSIRIEHSGTPITTGAWVELVASLSENVNSITVFSSSGQTLELGVGAAASEARVAYLPPGGFDAPVIIRLAAGARVSARAVSANATTGELQINFLGEN